MKNKPKMFFGATPAIHKRAQDLRASSTKAEEALWNLLSNKKFMGLKFRRQHAIALFIVDFYCHSLKLVIELDGSIHDRVDVKERDQFREEQLKNFGLFVVRFSNEIVINRPEEVLTKLSEIVNELQRQDD
jgi:very-short-patch-repair endonuclease